MNVSCKIDEYFENWRDWFLLEEDRERSLLELFINNEKVIEKNVLNHFSLLRCKLEITNFTGVIRSVGSKYNSSSLSFSRTIPLSLTIRSIGVVSIVYNIIRE